MHVPRINYMNGLSVLQDDDLADNLKGFTKLTKTKEPFVAIINIPRKEVCEYKGELTADALNQFVADHIAGKLDTKSL